MGVTEIQTVDLRKTYNCSDRPKTLGLTDSLVKYNQRFARWVLQVQEYNITTTYVPGREQLADHMTRLSNYGANV